MPGTTLVRTTLTGVRPLGVRGEPLHHAQAQLRAVVRRRLGDRHFHLLAEPQPHDLGGRIDWYSELDGSVRPLASLPEAERDAARADIDALLADIDRVGQSLEAGPTEDGKLAGRSLRLAAKRPSDDYLFLVGEQPVVVCWGYDTEAAGAVLPGAFAPASVTSAPPMAGEAANQTFGPVAVGPGGAAVLVRERFPWLFWLLAGLLAILILLLTSYLLRQCMPVPPDVNVSQLPPEPPPPTPPAPPDPTIGLQGDLDRARDEEGKLRTTLASLRDEFAKRYAQCKPPEPPRPPDPPRVVERKPEPPTKPPERKPEPPPPPPKPPDDRMRMPTAPTNDYSFLKGCWRTDFFRHSPTHVGGTTTYCFDANGRGTMTFRNRDGRTCRSPATARFTGNTLRIDDTDGRCSDGADWYADHLDCRSDQGSVARCGGQSSPGNRWTVNLHRIN